MFEDKEVVIESTFGEILGLDVEGKTVECDVVTTVLTTDKAVSIVQDNKNPHAFRLLFPKEYEECHAGQCSHSDKDTECFHDHYQDYTFGRDMAVIIKESTRGVKIPKLKETRTMEMKTPQSNPDYHGALMRETNRILPELFRKMIGSGGVSLDTDSMSLSDPRDRHHLEWLARITAGFVLAEQAVWEPQVMDSLEVTAEYKERTGDLERLLDSMREAAEKEDVTVEELKELIGKYRNPLENHYDKMKQKRDKAAMMESWAQELMSPSSSQTPEDTAKDSGEMMM